LWAASTQVYVIMRAKDMSTATKSPYIFVCSQKHHKYITGFKGNKTSTAIESVLLHVRVDNG